MAARPLPLTAEQLRRIVASARTQPERTLEELSAEFLPDPTPYKGYVLLRLLLEQWNAPTYNAWYMVEKKLFDKTEAFVAERDPEIELGEISGKHSNVTCLWSTLEAGSMDAPEEIAYTCCFHELDGPDLLRCAARLEDFDTDVYECGTEDPSDVIDTGDTPFTQAIAGWRRQRVRKAQTKQTKKFVDKVLLRWSFTHEEKVLWKGVWLMDAEVYRDVAQWFQTQCQTTAECIIPDITEPWELPRDPTRKVPWSWFDYTTVVGAEAIFQKLGFDTDHLWPEELASQTPVVLKPTRGLKRKADVLDVETAL